MYIPEVEFSLSLVQKQQVPIAWWEKLLCIHLTSRQAHSDSGSERVRVLLLPPSSWKGSKYYTGLLLCSTGTEESIKRISSNPTARDSIRFRKYFHFPPIYKRWLRAGYLHPVGGKWEKIQRIFFLLKKRLGVLTVHTKWFTRVYPTVERVVIQQWITAAPITKRMIGPMLAVCAAATTVWRLIPYNKDVLRIVSTLLLSLFPPPPSLSFLYKRGSLTKDYCYAFSSRTCCSSASIRTEGKKKKVYFEFAWCCRRLETKHGKRKKNKIKSRERRPARVRKNKTVIFLLLSLAIQRRSLLYKAHSRSEEEEALDSEKVVNVFFFFF